MAIFSKDELTKEINYIIAFLNLIPLYPLDGGRILRGILFLSVGYKKSLRISTGIAKCLMIIVTLGGVVLLVYFKNLSLILLATYMCVIIKEESKKDRIQQTINELIGM